MVITPELSDQYKLAMDQWQRLTHAMKELNARDMVTAIRALEGHLYGLRMHLLSEENWSEHD